VPLFVPVIRASVTTRPPSAVVEIVSNLMSGTNAKSISYEAISVSGPCSCANPDAAYERRGRKADEARPSRDRTEYPADAVAAVAHREKSG
jgi:hypothetical protein